MNLRILRCHLLIGLPGSGKTTLAQDLASLIVGPKGQPAVVLSTDAIGAELFGDAAVQGPWPEIQQALVRRWEEAVADAIPVIIEQRERGEDGRFQAWPLQLLFHNISWSLVFEMASLWRLPFQDPASPTLPWLNPVRTAASCAPSACQRWLPGSSAAAMPPDLTPPSTPAPLC